MTSPNAAPPNPGTRTRPNPPSKTCSPSYAEPLSQHELPALPHPSPIHTNTATTNWPAPQPPHNCETQVPRRPAQYGLASGVPGWRRPPTDPWLRDGRRRTRSQPPDHSLAQALSVPTRQELG